MQQKLVNTISNVLCMVVPKLKRGKKWQKMSFQMFQTKNWLPTTGTCYVIKYLLIIFDIHLTSPIPPFFINLQIEKCEYVILICLCNNGIFIIKMILTKDKFYGVWAKAMLWNYLEFKHFDTWITILCLVNGQSKDYKAVPGAINGMSFLPQAKVTVEVNTLSIRFWLIS